MTVATGPTTVLANGAGGFQVGDGNAAEPNMIRQGTPAAYTTDTTATAADIMGGLVTVSGTLNMTMPLATDLDIALPNAGVNSAFDFSVVSIGANTATLVTNTGWTTVGLLTVLTTAAQRFRCRKTAAGAWTLYRIA